MGIKNPSYYGNFNKTTKNQSFYTATGGQTIFNIVYAIGNVEVYQNGRRLRNDVDFTATNGTSITLTTAATVNDDVICIGYK